MLVDQWIDMAWPFLWAFGFFSVYLDPQAVVIE